MANTQKPIKATLDNTDDSCKTQKPILIQLDEIPTPEAGDAGKALFVNAAEDGYELGEIKNQVMRVFFNDIDTTPTCDYTRAEIYQFISSGGIVLADSNSFNNMLLSISGSSGITGSVFENKPYSNLLWYYSLSMDLDDHQVPPAEEININKFKYSFTPTT